jgi:hypothetical protein
MLLTPRTGDLEPEDVEDLRGGPLGQPAVLAGRRVAAVGTDADDPAALAHEAAHRHTTFQSEIVTGSTC